MAATAAENQAATGAGRGRPTRGLVGMDGSDTARFAYVCAQLERRSDNRFLRETLGLVINTTAVKRSVSGLVAGRRGRGRAFRPWLLVDAAELDVGTSIVTVPVPEGSTRRHVVAQLARIAGVRQLIAPAAGDVLAVVLHDGEQDRRRLVHDLSEFVDDPVLMPVEHETFEPSIATWRRLARRRARRERLADARASDGR